MFDDCIAFPRRSGLRRDRRWDSDRRRSRRKPLLREGFARLAGITGGTRKGHKRVLRGGSWLNDGRNLRSANRNANAPDNRNRNIGLRLAGASLTTTRSEGQ